MSVDYPQDNPVTLKLRKPMGNYDENYNSRSTDAHERTLDVS